MRSTPKIGKIGEVSDFHDSSLISFQYLPTDDIAVVILSTPNDRDIQELWQVRLYGVLGIEIETLGSGECLSQRLPVEVYDVYDDTSAQEITRWKRRLEQLGVRDATVLAITFASSFLRGWGEKAELEGIRVVCRNVDVRHAPKKFNGDKFSRPRIEAGD